MPLLSGWTIQRALAQLWHSCIKQVINESSPKQKEKCRNDVMPHMPGHCIQIFKRQNSSAHRQ